MGPPLPPGGQITEIGPPAGPMLVLGNRAVFDLRRGAEPSSPLVRRIDR